MGRVDVNREIARIRALPGQNFHALAIQALQDAINSLPTTTAAATTTPSTPVATGGTVTPAVVTPSAAFNLYVNGVLSTKNSGNLNNSMPPAPAGFASVGFKVDNSMPIPNIGAYVPNVGFVNNQVGASYTILPSDFGKLVIFTNAGAVTVTIDPSTIPSNFFCGIASFGAGGLTITPASGTIDGVASLALTTNQGLPVYSDGTNLWTERGLSSGSVINYADAEIPAPAGGSNYTLAHAPTPPASLQLFNNGVLLTEGAGNDYTLSGLGITLAVPAGALICWYRY
jgi:hypothetical protein